MITVLGGKEIFGEINLSGAKNSALPIIVAACLASDDVVLNNIPVALNDVQVLIAVLRDLGYKIVVEGNSLYFNKPNMQTISTVVSDEASKIRYSLLLLPLLLSARGKVSNPSPGGCNLGDRKYDIHLDLLQRLGAQIDDNLERITGKLEDGFKGCELLFHTATTSGSESAIIAAAISKGKTIIKNANTRPEVIDLINFLNHLGAKITYKTRYIEIEGVDKLDGGEYEIISDSHEGVSYIILAAMTRSEIKINNFNTKFIKEDVELLRSIGVEIFKWHNDLYVSAKNRELRPFSMATSPYPGINSDMQPLLAALATTIQGESIITDTRFTERFQYVEEFLKLGADIDNYQNCAIIQGGKTLTGAAVYATDLRAGAALTFLAAVAQGKTTIENYYQTERGYANIFEKMQGLGITMKRD